MAASAHAPRPPGDWWGAGEAILGRGGRGRPRPTGGEVSTWGGGLRWPPPPPPPPPPHRPIVSKPLITHSYLYTSPFIWPQITHRASTTLRLLPSVYYSPSATFCLLFSVYYSPSTTLLLLPFVYYPPSATLLTCLPPFHPPS